MKYIDIVLITLGDVLNIITYFCFQKIVIIDRIFFLIFNNLITTAVSPPERLLLILQLHPAIGRSSWAIWLACA